jgi:hypothetical protein
MNTTNWSAIENFEGFLTEANRFAPFWTGILYMLWIILIITFLPFGTSAAIIGGSFIAFMLGIFLVYIEKRVSVTFINLAILSWICMNVSWMFSEVLNLSSYLVMAKTFFGVGCLFILLAVIKSNSVSDTFSHFKRFRIKNFKL